RGPPTGHPVPACPKTSLTCSDSLVRTHIKASREWIDRATRRWGRRSLATSRHRGPSTTLGTAGRRRPSPGAVGRHRAPTSAKLWLSDPIPTTSQSSIGPTATPPALPHRRPPPRQPCHADGRLPASPAAPAAASPAPSSPLGSIPLTAPPPHSAHVGVSCQPGRPPGVGFEARGYGAGRGRPTRPDLDEECHDPLCTSGSRGSEGHRQLPLRGLHGRAVGASCPGRVLRAPTCH